MTLTENSSWAWNLDYGGGVEGNFYYMAMVQRAWETATPEQDREAEEFQI